MSATIMDPSTGVGSLEEQIKAFNAVHPEIEAALRLFNTTYAQYEATLRAQRSVKTYVSEHTLLPGKPA